MENLRISPEAPKPIQLSFPLPNAPHISIAISLTIQSTSLLLFMTTTSTDAPSPSCPLGSFVYAIPNRVTSQPPLTTPLYTQSQTLDLATRMASVLAKRTGKPSYVGNSMSFAGAGRGGDVEEEMAGFRRVVEVVMGEIERAKGGLANGT